jgi:hypothetical protein
MYARTIKQLLLSLLSVILLSPSLAGASGFGMGMGGPRLQGPVLPFELPTWSVAQLAAKPQIVTGKKPKAAPAPELDPAPAASAAVLLLGGTLVAFGRRQRRGRPSGESARGGAPELG